MTETMNQNLTALAEGNHFRVEIRTANMGRSAPEFARTKAEANRRVKSLRSLGYNPSIFAITETGGLFPAR